MIKLYIDKSQKKKKDKIYKRYNVKLVNFINYKVIKGSIDKKQKR